MLRKKKLYSKRYKCAFGQDKVEYLEHSITGEGIKTDPAKVEAMVTWPLPRTLKALRFVLGLTGYYRRFMRNYGWFNKPLTGLLKKNSFC